MYVYTPLEVENPNMNFSLATQALSYTCVLDRGLRPSMRRALMDPQASHLNGEIRSDVELRPGLDRRRQTERPDRARSE